MMMDSRHQGSIFILGSVLGSGAEVKRSGRARGRPSLACFSIQALEVAAASVGFRGDDISHRPELLLR